MAYFPPPNGTDMANGSFIEEVQNQEKDLIESAREQAYLQDPTLKYDQRELVRGLLADKMDYQKAYEAGDTQGMAAAALNAKSRRERARAIGWDPSAYGENVSLVEATQNLVNNDARALHDIFYNLKNTGRTYTQDVADYLDQGYSIDSAKRLAEQNAEYNTQDNMNSLVDAFHMYGKDPRGAINDNGLRILGQMAQAGGASPSELANFYAQMQASPKDSWNFENSLLTAQNAQNYALDRMARSQQYTRENQARAFAQQEKMARLSNDLGIQRMMAQAQIQINSGIMSKEAGYNWTVQKLMEAGVDEMTARQYAATRLLGGKNGNNGGISATKMAEVEGKLAGLRESVLSGEMDVPTFLAQAKTLTPYYGDESSDAEEAVEGIAYLANFKRQINSYGYDDPAALDYYRAIRNDSDLMTYVPSDVREEMEKRLAKTEKQESSESEPSSEVQTPKRELTEQEEEDAQRVEEIAANNLANNPWGVIGAPLTEEQKRHMAEAEAAKKLSWVQGRDW